jgi:hypothetical protein
MKTCFIIFTLYFTLLPSAFSGEEFSVFHIETKPKETFAIIIHRFAKPNSVINRSSIMVKKTIKENPHIKNWEKFKTGTKIKLYVSKKFLKEMLLKGKTKEEGDPQKNWLASSQIGIVNIQGENNKELELKLAKTTIKFSKNIGNLKYFSSFSIVKFFSINSSLASKTTSAIGFLPEVNLGVSKKISPKLSLSINYDLLNYFFTSQSSSQSINLAANKVHRISLKSYYILSPSFGALGSVGYILGDASGLDGSLGLNYLFGKKKNYSTALIAYFSSLNVNNQTEASNAFILSFGWKFESFQFHSASKRDLSILK